MMEEKVLKQSFLTKVFPFKAVFAKREAKRQPISRFKVYLQGLDRKSDEYEYVSTAADLCEDAMIIAKRRIYLGEKIKKIEEKMKEVESFRNLTDDQVEKLRSLVERYTNISKEKSGLYFQVTGFDHNLSHLERLEQDAQFAITQMQESEKKQRILRHDIGYIEGEKADLEYEKEMVQKSIAFMRRFSLVALGVFIFTAFVLAYAFVFQLESILLPTFAISCGLLIVLTLLYVFRRRSFYELKKNVKKQIRAVELLNKKNVVLAYYANFLKYEYKKYKVSNAQMLKNNLKELDSYRHLSRRYDALRKIMYQAEEELESFFRHHNIKSNAISLERFMQTLNIDDKIKYYQELEKEKASLESDLEVLDARHEEVWDLLLAIHENDDTPDSIVDQLIQDYFDEMGDTMKQPIDKEVLIG